VDDQFWKEVAQAVDLVTNSGMRRLDGHGFKVYRVPGDLTRIDINPKEVPNGSGNAAEDG
jgi:hypothetical protein